jgi:hypothetical protein
MIENVAKISSPWLRLPQTVDHAMVCVFIAWTTRIYIRDGGI